MHPSGVDTFGTLRFWARRQQAEMSVCGHTGFDQEADWRLWQTSQVPNSAMLLFPLPMKDRNIMSAAKTVSSYVLFPDADPTNCTGCLALKKSVKTCVPLWIGSSHPRCNPCKGRLADLQGHITSHQHIPKNTLQTNASLQNFEDSTVGCSLNLSSIVESLEPERSYHNNFSRGLFVQDQLGYHYGVCNYGNGVANENVLQGNRFNNEAMLRNIAISQFPEPQIFLCPPPPIQLNNSHVQLIHRQPVPISTFEQVLASREKILAHRSLAFISQQPAPKKPDSQTAAPTKRVLKPAAQLQNGRSYRSALSSSSGKMLCEAPLSSSQEKEPECKATLQARKNHLHGLIGCWPDNRTIFSAALDYWAYVQQDSGILQMPVIVQSDSSPTCVRICLAFVEGIFIILAVRPGVALKVITHEKGTCYFTNIKMYPEDFNAGKCIPPQVACLGFQASEWETVLNLDSSWRVFTMAFGAFSRKGVRLVEESQLETIIKTAVLCQVKSYLLAKHTSTDSTGVNESDPYQMALQSITEDNFLQVINAMESVTLCKLSDYGVYSSFEVTLILANEFASCMKMKEISNLRHYWSSLYAVHLNTINLSSFGEGFNVLYNYVRSLLLFLLTNRPARQRSPRASRQGSSSQCR